MEQKSFNGKKIELTTIISTDHFGRRLDQTLTKIFSNYSRSYMKKQIISQHVRLNGNICDKPKKRVSGGESVSIEINLKEEKYFKSQNIPLNILYEDDYIIIINKPSNFIVHPGVGNTDGTVLNALLHYYPPIVDIPRAGIVHRLDKDTTGLMVIAKTILAYVRLIRFLKLRRIIREYDAVVTGYVKKDGIINKPINRHPIKRICMSIHSMGKPAITHYRIVEHFRTHTRLRFLLETGRTHQIRVHTSHISHPLVGDKLYGARLVLHKNMSEPLIQMLRKFNRQALHAEMLRFHHPITGVEMEWRAPLPQDMFELIKVMREDLKALNLRNKEIKPFSII